MTALPLRLAAVALFIAASAVAIHPTNAADPAEVLKAVVGVRAEVPPGARSAEFLGTERLGSGVVIDDDGLVLTIGYLVLEASGASVRGPDGKTVPASVVAYDHDSGFGLLKTTKPLDVTPMRLGDSNTLKEGTHVLVVSQVGEQPMTSAQVVSRRAFPGYWEYLLESAIFTAPPHGNHSGAALIGGDGRLLGIGSLFVAEAAAKDVRSPGNMFVPVNELKPVLADLLENGRRTGPVRPWIGANSQEVLGRVTISRISPGGPAARAGLKEGDLILGVSGLPVADQADFYRKLWSSGKAGDVVPLNVLRHGEPSLAAEEMKIRTMDRYDWLTTDSTL